MSAVSDFLTEPNFWWGGLAGTIVTGIVAPLLTARSLRASDRRKADQEDKMDTKKAEREDLRSNRQLIRETATAFSEVCSSIFEKAIDAKGIFNAVTDAAATMSGGIDKKALDKVEYSISLVDETKRITTAYNNLRVVAPVPVLDKATALNAAVIALISATTMPLAKPPLMAEAGKAMDDFTNAVRAELGLDPYTAADAVGARATYMETLTKQMNDYVKETQEEARRLGFLEPGFLEPGGLAMTTIKAGDLTGEHIGKFVGCHDPQSGFNYGAKIANIIRKDDGPNPGILLWLKHPAIPGGKSGHDDRSRLPFDHEVQLLEMPPGYGGVPQ